MQGIIEITEILVERRYSDQIGFMGYQDLHGECHQKISERREEEGRGGGSLGASNRTSTLEEGRGGGGDRSVGDNSRGSR